jgi:4-amino-4-deoxy-L-arabinose transferase
VDFRRAYRLIVAVLLLFAFALAFQGSRGLYSPDEGRYTGVALEMLHTGDWLHPRLHHELAHYTKPPLVYWTIAASLAAFGANEWAARLPPALAFFGTALLVFGMGRRLVPQRPWLPALIYASCLMPYVAANVITTDTVLAFCVALYAYAYLRVRASQDDAARRSWLALLGLGAGLAFLDKGPPALLPLLALFAHSATTPGERPLRDYASVPALLIFAAVGLGWYAVIGLEKPELLRYFLVEEIWHRVTSAEMHRNAQWYGGLVVYLPTLILGLLPWTVFAARPAWRALRAPARALERLRDSPDARLLAWWIVLPLGVFFIARSRLPLYVLPLFVPLSLALARRLAGVPLRAWHALGLAVWLLALIALRAVASVALRDDDDRQLAHAIGGFGLSQIDEIAFVDTAPRYGLMLYLGSSVERLSLDSDAVTDPQTQNITAELTESEGCRLLLLPHARAAELEREIAADGDTAVVVGYLSGYTGYIVEDGHCRRTR